jgi:hypothetical protein
MSIWKRLSEKKPEDFASVIVLTRGNCIRLAFYNPEDKKFYNRIGLVKPISYKRWCYDYELVQQALEEINQK